MAYFVDQCNETGHDNQIASAKDSTIQQAMEYVFQNNSF
jgi:hypothetical protein